MGDHIEWQDPLASPADTEMQRAPYSGHQSNVPPSVRFSGVAEPLLPGVRPAGVENVNPSRQGQVQPHVSAQFLRASRENPVEETTEVHVNIGRIEIAAVHAPAAPKRSQASGKQPMSLDEYLAKRQRDSR